MVEDYVWGTTADGYYEATNVIPYHICTQEELTGSNGSLFFPPSETSTELEALHSKFICLE